jgi:hypothetical protein
MVNYYHVYRGKNNLVEHLAKVANKLEQRKLIINQKDEYEPIP